ncbi:hypothetical protein MN202_09590 [Rheinheimera muenzenbergensis]|uniref:Uncharacterized protein n=1 Tax=Rheinheimera muenzenbergensis TaxID=1193628 RepID=A0ABU8C6C4_9GAMM
MTSNPNSSYTSYSQFFEYWQNNTGYLSLSSLQHGSCYRIFARNAEVGIWDADYEGFLIARFKLGPEPYLFYELHWDSCADHGTVKPVEKLCDGPLHFQGEAERTSTDEQQLIDFLLDAEQRYPLIAGRDSIGEKRESAVRFLQHLQRKKPAV